jgi:hypothetical protein
MMIMEEILMAEGFVTETTLQAQSLVLVPEVIMVFGLQTKLPLLLSLIQFSDTVEQLLEQREVF